MKAIVFAAGLGTRLRPYTDDRPKALVQIGPITLLELQLRRLHHFGFKEVVVNIHHFADLMVASLNKMQFPGMRIHISDERDQVLETGGGLLKASSFWEKDEPVLAINVDVLTDLNLAEFWNGHVNGQSAATLAVLQRPSSRQLTFDKRMQLTGWRNLGTGETKGSPAAADQDWAFCGIHIFQTRLLHQTQLRGVFSVIDLYMEQLGREVLVGKDLSGIIWMDVGKPKELEEGQLLLPKILP